MLATGEEIRSTGEAISPRVNMLDEALLSGERNREPPVDKEGA